MKCLGPRKSCWCMLNGRGGAVKIKQIIPTKCSQKYPNQRQEEEHEQIH